MIQIAINKTCASVQHIEPITSGAINVKMQVTFDSSWDSLNKTAVFTNGAITKDVLESQWAEGNIITIPHEVLTPNASVRMGVYGYNLVDGVATAVPSVYVQLAKIRVGADPLADITTDPTLPVYAQLQWEIDHFEVSPEQIAQQIEEYIAEHPLEIPTASASVLGGVKIGDGLSVTPDGTLSADSIDAYTKAETDALLDGKQPSGDYATSGELDALADIVEGKADAADIPSLDGYATESYVQNYHDNTKQDVISDLATIRSGAALGATAVQPDALDDYAEKSDLDDKQGKALVVNIERIGGAGGGSYTADKTNAEIYAAWQAGREVIAELSSRLSSSKLHCVSAIANAAYFPSILGEETATIRIEDDVVTATAFDLQPKTIADTAGYFTTDTVEGALAEIGAKLAAYPSDVWEGGSYGG